MNPSEELIQLLNAIQIVRGRWLAAVRIRADELRSANSELSESQAFNRALSDGDSNIEFQKLLNLYGIIGQNTPEFIESLMVKILSSDQKAA